MVVSLFFSFFLRLRLSCLVVSSTYSVHVCTYSTSYALPSGLSAFLIVFASGEASVLVPCTTVDARPYATLWSLCDFCTLH